MGKQNISALDQPILGMICSESLELLNRMGVSEECVNESSPSDKTKAPLNKHELKSLPKTDEKSKSKSAGYEAKANLKQKEPVKEITATNQGKSGRVPSSHDTNDSGMNQNIAKNSKIDWNDLIESDEDSAQSRENLSTLERKNKKKKGGKGKQQKEEISKEQDQTREQTINQTSGRPVKQSTSKGKQQKDEIASQESQISNQSSVKKSTSKGKQQKED